MWKRKWLARSLLREVQQELSDDHQLVKQLKARKDVNGLYRVRSKVIMRKDTNNFRYSIMLPHDHLLVVLLVRWEHQRNSHSGHQALMGILRERFWIPKMRRIVRSVIYSCGSCRHIWLTELQKKKQHYRKIESKMRLCLRCRPRRAVIFEESPKGLVYLWCV